ncbi:hypothetical protein [Alkalicoccus urumqiensis]|uniref:Uncharacterized protein n=1 Tax=Alkalicoccus urumqiensis TaxID=1548213 RepID=A0A2P6MGF0_ALKUR|nr:hypothetical protein [Alkalicoccus urumqiensis]PRO65359.1 hypothetical protein C6I21_09355 [Alkalicoccus urumqiensis]
MTSLFLVLFVMPLLSFLVGIGGGYTLRSMSVKLLALPLSMVMLHLIMIFTVLGMSYAHWLIAVVMMAGIMMVPATVIGEFLQRKYPIHLPAWLRR